MTTSGTSRQEHDQATLDTPADDTNKQHATTRRTSTSSVSKKKQSTPKMPTEQRQKAPKKKRDQAPSLLSGKGTASTISKRNRRRKKLFTDPDQLESEIRQSYFAAASWVATRYSVSVEDLIDHLRAGGIHYASRPSTAIQYVEDVVLCVAICNGSTQAWNDLRQVFDLTLNRACNLTMSEQDSTVFVQRFLSELAEDTECSVASGPRTPRTDHGIADADHENSTLQDYIGLQPLRIWLTNKILANLEDLPMPQTITATDNGVAQRPSLQLVH